MTDTPKQWYKVLLDGKSCHGGSLKWSLPKGQRPGEWHEVKGALSLCNRGLHVTDCPAKWMIVGAQVYACEVDGIAFEDTDDSKACCRRVRLLREITGDELRGLQIVGDGELKISSGIAFAFGSCGIEASGSATVTAYDSATVTASGSATVTASGSATVRAYGSATVTASGSATVRAYDSATVRASGSATVTASGSATINIYGISCTVTETGEAVVIDRTKTPPVIRAGWEAKE